MYWDRYRATGLVLHLIWIRDGRRFIAGNGDVWLDVILLDLSCIIFQFWYVSDCCRIWELRWYGGWCLGS